MDKAKQSGEGEIQSSLRSKQREKYLMLSRELQARKDEARVLDLEKRGARSKERRLLEDEGWKLLRNKQNEKALALLRDLSGLTEGRDSRDSLGYGAALMWAGEYEAAIKHFESIIEISCATKRPMMLLEDHYALCGAGHWCLENQRRAVEIWQKGFKAPYAAYRAGSLDNPMLVLVASILVPGLCDRVGVLGLIKRRLSDPYVNGYPATLSQFVVGNIDNGALESSLERRPPREPQRSQRDRKFRGTFYRAVLDLERSVVTRAKFKKLMSSITEPFRFQDLEAGEFWFLTRSAEFYLAVHEARS